MPPTRELVQQAIHKMEMGGGARALRYFLLTLVVFCLAVLYDLHAYKNMFTPEGMDSAQLARNIATGKGYTTEFIRPLSLSLVQNHNGGQEPLSLSSTNFVDSARIQAHPDLANPPVYPVILAGLMKFGNFRYPIDLKHSFWTENDKFSRYQPDFLIAIFNQILLLVAVVMVFFLALKLFDARVAWTSAILTFGCELLWRFSSSGLSTLLLILLILGLVWCVIKIEELAREPQPALNQLLGWTIACGGLAGIGVLTRYAFGWVIIPILVFLLLFSGQRRILHAMVAFGVFGVILTPWIIRNYMISGTLFGTAGFAIMEQTQYYPQFVLERSLHPSAYGFMLKPYLAKMAVNIQSILSNDLPTLGGSWASIFFLAGLLLAFQKASIRRIRYFLLLCLGIFIVVQSLGRTELSVENPTVNSENLLILIAPMVFIYGTGFFFTLLDQLELPIKELSYAIIGGFVILCCLPMIFILLPPKTNPVAYPPYYPPDIQNFAGWMKPDELMMSDVPWAVAWYGDRQCVWLSRNPGDDFFDINDNVKTISALYLTPKTMNGRFLSDWLEASDSSWGKFIIQVALQGQIPPKFQLRAVPSGFLPDRLFLTDYPRWKVAK
ncbi:MAG TPA: glycosyltransferase family 39 protein [Verrucomicrobiae bacterium]